MDPRELAPSTPAEPETPPYARTRALLDALIHVESYALGFAEDLRQLQKDLKQTPPPRGFRYYAPPDEHDDEEAKRDIEARRAEEIAPPEFKLRPEDLAKLRKATRGQIDSDSINLHSTSKHHYRLFDMYHRDERQFRRVLELAKHAAREATAELDDRNAAPLARDTSKIKLDLQNLGGVVPAPFFHGNYPPPDPKIPELVRERLIPIEEWINRIRALVLPAPPSVPSQQRGEARMEPPGAGPATHPNTPTVSSQQPDGGDEGSPDARAEANPSLRAQAPQPVSIPLADGSWNGIQPDGPPLRGWHDILSAVGAKTDRNAQVAMKRRNKALGGPIRHSRGRPEVFRNQLLAWIRSTEDRAEQAVEGRDASAGARRELEERGGARQSDLGFQSKARRKDATRPDLRRPQPPS